MPLKPAGTNVKIYVIADETEYIYDFWVYQGSNAEHNANPLDAVHDFRSKVPSNEHVIIVDAYYGCLGLANALQEKRYKFVMTC